MQLEERRRRLVAESDQLRQRFADEGAQLQAATVWVEAGFSAAKLVLDWWPLIAAGAGFVLARKRRGWLRLLARALSLWRIVRRIFPFWKEFFAKPAAAKEPSG